MQWSGGTYSIGEGDISLSDLLELSFPLSTVGYWGMLVDLWLG